MRRRFLLVGGWGLALALAAVNGLAPARLAAAQQPSPRPPLSATDQYLTAIAPPPTQPAGGGEGGGGSAPTEVPASVTASPTPRRVTRTPLATPTPGPTQTPRVIVQTVVQTVQVPVVRTVSVVETVVVVVTAPAGPASPTPTHTLEPVGAGPVAANLPSGWLWVLILFPVVAIALAVLWLLRRDFILPGIYPPASRPRRIGRLLGRRKKTDQPRWPE
ncbi:MAG: hypothetical protein KA764_07505 [Anaerolineales bacterium]|nr:hypothetical protein [Anaerolineales bacterium]